MIKNIWNKVSSYQLSGKGKLFVGALLVIIIVLIVNWAA